MLKWANQAVDAGGEAISDLDQIAVAGIYKGSTDTVRSWLFSFETVPEYGCVPFEAFQPSFKKRCRLRVKNLFGVVYVADNMGNAHHMALIKYMNMWRFF